MSPKETRTESGASETGGANSNDNRIKIKIQFKKNCSFRYGFFFFLRSIQGREHGLL